MLNKNYIYNLFTSEEVKILMLDGTLYTEKYKTIWQVIEEEFISRNVEENYYNFKYILKDVVNNKYYKTYWGKSSWISQMEDNAEEPLIEVFPKEVTKIIYSEIP